MRVKSLLTVVAGAVLVAPLAFMPMMEAAEDRIRDGKAAALASGELEGAELHAAMDAAKQQQAEQTMAAIEGLELDVPAPAPCTAGFAGPYPCQNVDVASIVPLAELGGVAGNDSWGWTDPVEGNEIALVGTGTGLAFVDVTDPVVPLVLGRVESEVIDSGAIWRDVKVDNDHAFIVSENAGHGMQVFDLTRLREFYGTSNPANHLEPDHVDKSFGSAHNIAINPETDTAYIVGADPCSGGLHMIDISDPTATTVAGCFGDDGYTHDVQCVLYQGPDPEFNGEQNDGQPSEICFASNEDTVTIVDVTDKQNPEMLARIGYLTSAYTHQGWLTPDHRFFVFNDEVDEQAGTVDNTTTYMVEIPDLRDVDEPVGFSQQVKAFTHTSLSTDHNLYITDDELIWEANYNQGLRILAYTEDGLRNGELTEVGYFEVDSLADAPHYGDTWNVYPFFASGTVILSNLGQGLVVLQPDYEALYAAQDALRASMR